jgi:predicted HTH domain antitoxin
MAVFSVELPDKADLPAARFGIARSLIEQGGIVSVNEAAAIAGMERKAFIKAMLELGGQTAEDIEDAVDVDRIKEVKAEMARTGEPNVPIEVVAERHRRRCQEAAG